MKKKKSGIILLLIGLFLLIGSLFINRFIEIDDILCLIFMTISLMIEIYGLFIIIRESYK